MSCTYQTEIDAFGLYDVLQDNAAGIRLRIRRLGAEMVSLALRKPNGDWEGFLYRDNETGPPSAGWGNHATVMGYYIHRLVDGQTRYRGRRISGGNHGFLRSFEFEAPTFDPVARSLAYGVQPARIPPDAYPLRVALRLSYRLDGHHVAVSFEFSNDEDKEAHVSFGLHPGFAVTSLDEAEVLLPPGTYERHWAPGNFLDGRVDRIVFEGGPMPFAKPDLPGSFLLGLDGVPEPVLVLRDPPSGRRVDCDFHGVPYATLWSEAPAFICIEPCWGLPDSIPQKPFQQKDGIQVIEAGSRLVRSFSLRVGFDE
jgi:galactose mutarotase-like enzyme